MNRLQRTTTGGPGGLDLKNVADRSALGQPGSSDGETKLVREGTMVRAYKWSEAAREWDLIGDVVDAAPNTVNGKVYDHVIDVKLSDEGPALKLGHNDGENPYWSAQRFIDDNELDQQFLREIAEFIIRNVEQKEQQTLTTYDPSRGNVDPLTGNPTAAGPFPQHTEPAPPRRSAPSSRSGMFPVMAPVLFRTVRVANVREKLFSSAAAEKLSKEQRDGLEAVLETIGTDEYATREISPGQVELLNNLMTFWDQEELAPVMDVFRCVILFEGAHSSNFVEDAVSSLLMFLNGESKPGVAHMLALWALSNAFSSEKSKVFLNSVRSLLLDTLELMLQHSNDRHMIGLSTVLLNMTISNNDISDLERRCKLALEIVRTSGNDEAVFRSMCAIGTAITLGKGKVELLGESILAVQETMDRQSVEASSGKTKAAAKELAGLVGHGTV